MFKRLLHLVGLLVVLSACGGGGGGSDSGGGGSGVQFQGNETLTVSIDGTALSERGTYPLSATVAEDVVTITDINQNQYSGIVQVNGSFSATGVQNLGELSPGVRCGGIRMTYLGTVVGNTISGSSEGATQCETDSGNVTTVQKGTFSVSM